MSEFADYSSLTFLVERIKESNDERAFDAFHKRFQPYIIKVLYYKRYQPFLIRYYASGLETRDLVQDVFLKVLQLIPEFDIRGKTEKEAEKILFQWLGNIARIVVLKAGEKLKPENSLVDFINSEEKDQVLRKLMDDTFLAETYPLELSEIETILNTKFSERERIILFTYANENCLSSNRRLQAIKLEELASHFQTSKSNIKQIYHRSFKKLESGLKSG